MKSNLYYLLYIILFNFLLSGNTNAQTILVHDQICYVTETYLIDGTHNGRNAYSHASNSASIFWDGSQWVLSFNVIGSTSSEVYTMAGNSSPNPLSSSVASTNGTPWTPAPGFETCETLQSVSVTGSGTQSMLTLPVELISFRAKEFPNYTELSWQTASEINNEKFEIEESSDGREFRKTGEVSGNGTVHDPKDYSIEVDKRQNEITYYRLKQIDFDGQYEYSDIISLKTDGATWSVGELFPNPSNSGLVSLRVNSRDDLTTRVSVSDMVGNEIFNQDVEVSDRGNLFNFDFSSFDAGLYIIRIEAGSHVELKRLVIAN